MRSSITKSKPLTPFSVGRRWRCTKRRRDEGRVVYDFIILGAGKNIKNKPSKYHSRCRIEVLAEDRAAKRPGYKSHGMESTYSHVHMRKVATLMGRIHVTGVARLPVGPWPRFPVGYAFLPVYLFGPRHGAASRFHHDAPR